MTLRVRYATAEDIPEALRDHYAQTESGAFVLQAEGLRTEDDVEAVKEALRKERDARKEAEKASKDRNLAAPDLEGLRQVLTEREREVQALNDRLDESLGRLRQAGEDRLKAAVLEACARAGVRDLNRTDAWRAAKELFAVDDGLSVVSKDGERTLDGWLAEVRQSGGAAWWDVGSGGGMPPSRASSVAPNPFALGSLNLTEQGRLMRENPDMAKRLREQAKG
ncbi:hypothetical protein [Rhodospirillum sp. A1_3_36]|uniref:hypothetical protein n=1 Tax=Rhodospirillum sp. A1_3_36 TaxID=3391666 RepID=UPI0039A77F09